MLYIAHVFLFISALFLPTSLSFIPFFFLSSYDEVHHTCDLYLDHILDRNMAVLAKVVWSADHFNNIRFKASLLSSISQ
jgi:hypothetical protein